MSGLQIYLFGPLRIHRDGRPLHGLDAGKAQELLSFLLLHRDRAYPREILADLLWAETSVGPARKVMRQAIWQLQNALDLPSALVEQRLLMLESDLVNLNPAADLWCDAIEFERLCALARDVQGRDLDADAARALESAVALYRGDFLEGWYHDWCLHERERIQNLYLQLLAKLMGYGEAHGAYEHSMAHGERILDRERAHERTHRHLMRLHYLAGDRTSAIRQYERCVEALREDLGVAPSGRTTALYEQIRADHAEPVGGEPNAERADRPPGLAEQLQGLRELMLGMAGIQRRIQESLEAIALTLKSQR